MTDADPDAAGRDADGFLTPARVRGLFHRSVVHWNAGAFFEAHEDWETIWHEAEGRRRLWLQGLIQLAAAFHHVDHGTSSGLVKLLRSAREKVEGYAGDPEGLDVARLHADLEPWYRFAEAVAAGAPRRGPATPAFPTLRLLPGVVLDPLPPDPDPAP